MCSWRFAAIVRAFWMFALVQIVVSTFEWQQGRTCRHLSRPAPSVMPGYHGCDKSLAQKAALVCGIVGIGTADIEPIRPRAPALRRRPSGAHPALHPGRQRGAGGGRMFTLVAHDIHVSAMRPPLAAASSIAAMTLWMATASSKDGAVRLPSRRSAAKRP